MSASKTKVKGFTALFISSRLLRVLLFIVMQEQACMFSLALPPARLCTELKQRIMPSDSLKEITGMFLI